MNNDVGSFPTSNDAGTWGVSNSFNCSPPIGAVTVYLMSVYPSWTAAAWDW